MPLITQLTPATIYQAFSQTINVSAGTTGETVSSITVTKTPISTGGTGTSLAYQSLTLNGQNFISTDSLTFSYGAGTSQITFTLAGTYTDYPFSDQVIKYYNNPNKVTIGVGTSTTTSSTSVNRTVSNDAANPKVNSYIINQTSQQTATTANNRSQYYYTTQGWANVPNPVDAIYSFQPSAQSSINYFTYTFSIQFTNLFGSGTSTFAVTHTLNYDLNYEKQQFLNVLNNQRFGGPPL